MTTIAFLKIRISQLARMMNGLGLFRFLLLLALLLVLFRAIWFWSSKESSAWIAASLAGALLLIAHTKRSDRRFLQQYIETYKAMMTAEYLLASLPLLAGLAYHRQWLQLLLLLLVSVSLPMLKPQHNHNGSIAPLQKLVPDKSIEWKSGLRRYWIPILILWFTGLVFSHHEAGILIVVLFISLFTASFFEPHEPLNVLRAAELPVHSLLMYKFRWHLVPYLFFVTPLLVLYIIQQASWWFLAPLLLIAGLSVQLYAVLVRYAFYDPEGKSNANGFFTSIGSIALFLPLMLPMVWLLMVYFYFKSVKKLTPLLHDLFA
jgi:hypothetical protein